MDKQILLGKAIEIATKAHSGQYDKGGKPYILHPLRLMTQLLFDTELAMIAVMHDVVEDGDYTLEDLRNEGFSERVLAALALLTHDSKDDYLKVYIPRIAGNYDSLRVKRKDLKDNSDITRLKGIRPKDIARVEKYFIAYTYLGDARKYFQSREYPF